MDPIITREIQDETCKQDHKSGNEEAHATTAAPAAESLCDSLPPLQNFDPAVQADNNLRWQPVESRSEHLIDKPCKELTARRIDFNHAMFDPPIISRVVSRDKDEDDIMIDQNGSNDDDLIISLLNVSDYDQLFRSMHEYNDDDETVAGKVSLDEALIFQELAFDDDASKQHDDCDDSNKPLQSITCGGKYLHESPISCASSLSIYNTHNDDDGDAASSTTLPFASTSMEQFLLNFECQLDETVHDLRQTMQQQEDEQRQQFNVKRQKASMLITTFMKRHRSSVHRVKHDQYLELANASMAWRKKWERDTSSCRMHDAAAIKIQSVVRGQASRRRTSMLLHEIKRELAQSDFSSTLLLQEISAEMTYSDSREAARLIQTILRRYKVKQTAGRRQRVQHETIADTPPRLIKSRNNVSSSSAAFVNDSPARRLIQTMLASTRISNVWRQSLNERHHEEESAVAAASVIQCAVRRWLATKKLVPLQEEQTRRGEELRQQSHRVAAANLLARIWSGFATRRRFLCSRKASVKLQQGWRMHRARQLYIRRQRSSTMLQNLLRCYLSRRKLLAAVQKMKLDRAVTLVARQWRRFVTRKKFAANIKALVTMQRAIRLHQLKMAGTTVRVARAAREKAASKLQATWRRRECRQVNSKQTNPPENRKIVTIQSIIRRYHARGTYVNLHDLRFEISAVRIASFWRHVVNRRRYNAMRYAALILQRHLRKCMMTRLKVSPIASSANLQVSSPLLPSSLAIQVTSAGKMQRIVRQFLARKHAATHIQRAYISSPMKRQQARKLLLEASSFFKANWRSKYNYKFNSPVRCTALSSHESLQTLDNASAVKAIIVLQTKSTQIQAAWRKALACIQYALVRKSVILCQSVARLFIARQKLETSSNSSLKHNLNGCHELIEVQDKRNICIIKRNLNASAVKCIQKRWRRHAQLRTERWQIKPAAGRRVQQCRAREGRAALIEQQALLVPTELRQIPMKKALVACNEQKHFIANVVLVQNVWRRYMCCKAQLAQQAAVILLQAGARGMLTRNQTQHTRSRNLFACRRVQRRFRAFAASRRSREYPKSSLSASKRNMKTLIRHEAPLSSGTGDQAHGSLRPSIPEFVTVYDHDVDSLSGTLDAKEPTTFQNESPKSYSFGLRSLMAMSILSLAVVLFSHQPSDSTCLAKGCRSVDLSTFSSHSDNDSPASGAKMVELRRYDFEVSVPPLISLTTNELELIKFNVEGSFDKDVPTAACTDPSNNEETIADIDTASKAVVDSPNVGLEIFESVFASDAAADTNEIESIKINLEGSFDKDVPTAACTDSSNNEDTIAVIDTASEAVVDSPSVGLEIFESDFASDGFNDLNFKPAAAARFEASAEQEASVDLVDLHLTMQYVGLSALEMEISTHHDGDVVATARSNGPTPAENEVVNCDSISVYRKEYDYPSQFDAPAEISDSVEIGELELTASLDEVISFKEPEEYLALQDSSQMLNSDVAVAGSDADAVVELVNDAWSSAVFDSFIDESRGLETFDTRFSAGASTSGSENGLALEDLKAIPMGDDIPEDEESIDGNPNFFNNSLDVLNKRDQALSFELSEVITMKNREPSQHITEEVGLTDQLEHTLESHDVNEGTYSISASDLAASRRHVPINELWTLDLDEVILSSVNEETEPISFAPLDRLVELWTVDLDGLYMNESPATNANGNFGSATITSEEFPRRGNLEHDEDLERLALQINSIVHDVTHRTRICMEAINKL